jgi:hypothetical protein
MMEIKFSHSYPKLHGQIRATLLSIIMSDRKNLNPELVHYDTLYLEPDGVFPCVEKHYPLPDGPLMILVFVGNKLIPFTTVRRWTAKIEEFYRQNINQVFDVKIMKTKKVEKS